MSNFCDQLKVNIQSLAAIVQVISHETLRIRAYCIQAAEELQRDLYLWNGCEGLKRYNPSDKQFENVEDFEGTCSNGFSRTAISEVKVADND